MDRLFPPVRRYDTRAIVRSLRLQNFRSFVDTGTIELRPLMVLVGANSAGKSSFLRFFPLLKQTVEAPSSGPLLWYGRYVDFGDFASVVRRGSAERNIDLTFELPSRLVNDTTTLPITIHLSLGEKEGKTGLSRIVIKLAQDTCEFRLNDSGQVRTCLLNDVKLTGQTPEVTQQLAHSLQMQWISGSIMPRFQNDTLATITRKILIARISELSPADRINISSLLVEKIRYFGQPEQFHQHLLSLDHRKSWKTIIKNNPPQSSRIKRLRSLVLATQIANRIDMANVSLSGFARSVSYIGPFRKDPVRFDRKQELSVQQIDPHGDNLAMFLLSLSSKDREDFDHWAAQHFGFGIKVDSTPSHVSVLIHDGKEAFNLIDMGYGLSQVLPVIAQCWLAAKRHPSVLQGVFSFPALTAIEQPELHLHPRFQARLADLFVGVIQASKAVSAVAPSTQLVIETHSESMISRLGELVSLGKLERKDCSVLLFQKESTGNTTVRTAEFNEDGMLSDWPVGFLSA